MNESLKVRIDKVTKEIEETERKMDEVHEYMKKLGLHVYARPTTTETRLTGPWDQYHTLRQTLGLFQQKLSSLLMESLKETTEQLDSSVQSLNVFSESLLKTIGKVKESSNRLESLTVFLLVLATLSIYVVGGKDLPFPYNLIEAIAIVALFLVAYFYPQILRRVERDRHVPPLDSEKRVP